MSAAEREAERAAVVYMRGSNLGGKRREHTRETFIDGYRAASMRYAEVVAERDAAREALARAHQTREAGVTAATEIARLRAFLDAVRALHQPLDAINVDAPPGRQRTRVCAVCAGSSGPWAVWPCATIQAIEGDKT